MPALPNFLIIGAPRAATTSLHYYLAQHPAVCMSSIKEPNHFLFDSSGGRPRPLVADDPRIVRKSVADREDYRRLFTPHGASAVGEASPLYLYTEHTPGLVARALPDIRAVAVVRDPVARAWSHFTYITPGLGDRTAAAFMTAARTEMPLPDSPYRPGTHHLRLGRYAAQLQRWRDALDDDRLLVLGYDDVVTDPAAALARICRFVGVDDGFGFDTATRFNPATQGAAAGRGRLDRVMKPLRPALKRMLPPQVAGRLAHRRASARAASAGPAAQVPPEVREQLRDYFAADVATVRESCGIELDAGR